MTRRLVSMNVSGVREDVDLRRGGWTVRMKI